MGFFFFFGASSALARFDGLVVAPGLVHLVLDPARLALDELVELATVEPDAAARGAVVDLDPLAVGDREHGVVDGTVHERNLLRGERTGRRPFHDPR